MDKCTYCAGGPEATRRRRYAKYGAIVSPKASCRLRQMCSTKSLLAGDGAIHRRNLSRSA